jgi:hypothetical protein
MKKKVNTAPEVESLPCCDPSTDGQLKRNVFRQVFEAGHVSLFPLLQHPDFLPLPAQLGSLLGEEGRRTPARLAHHSANLAPLTL